MKPVSYRLALTGIGLILSMFCNSMVVAEGEAETRTKFAPHNSDQYIPRTPQPYRGYIWPTQGRMTSGFGIRFGNMHNGIDIAGPMGTPIFAAASGVVIYAGWSPEGYGQLIKLRHPDGSLTFYGHNNRLLVRRGQQVEQGQQISEMGSTGNSTGPHLHFEIHPQGIQAVNPIAFLPEPVGVTNVRTQSSPLGFQDLRN
ncbi:Peptidase M23 [Rippkaea orientalis PCC 8801]|uniref:Peptidase M23 n=1 Tax=Rippkaea orientalis (strain PCC 8801 / RF-1) TaxID=41431 RepID=B7JXG4_RIPO1|nr:M23 family metallopeptidase [Rippkaea orientalis]ACK64721.1 Peptidase M23 [Rippkaea orientalis PCC 8801]